jgi:hypothetical protein
MPFLSGGLLPGLKIAGDILGGRKDRQSVRDTNSANIAMQKEFAQQGIGWKVADAKKAGIHPLFALGASTHSPSIALQPTKGSAIKDIANQIPSSLLTLQKKSIEADIALKMARTAEVAKRANDFTSKNTDLSTDNIVEPEPYKLPTYAPKSANVGARGVHLKTPLGGLLYNDKQATAQQLEDQTGEIMSMIVSTMNTAKAWGNFRALQKAAEKKFPLRQSKRGLRSRYKEYNARIRNKRAHYIKQQIRLLTGVK